MRKLVVNTFLTLDGVMQAPGGPEEDTDGGFARGGWTVPFWDDRIGEKMGEIMGKPFDLVLGRRTYEIFAGFWPTASEEEGAKPLNDATKHVASRTLTSLEWQNSQLIKGDVVEGVRALKQEDGPELQVHGSSNLLQTLIRAGLVDLYNLSIFPVTVGPGKRLFGDGAMPGSLKLVDSATTSTGVVLATFESAGELQTGTFGA
ncbi:MAG TPA: dihydrofolate reductase family protein [Actinomycetota bacterium]|nr:dihydrofolate reductase family protein [Actinomycetota bacterium]